MMTWIGRWFSTLTHHHGPEQGIDRELATHAEGIRAVKISLLALSLTAALEAIVVALSGSVALLSDMLHNIGDALTAIPLWVAFALMRKPANDRYTHGYGRAEDLAGIFIVLVIAVSAAIAGYETITRLVDPKEIENLGLVIVAALVGFAGNELVALYRIKVGRKIGSAALVADGLHARTDGLTSLAVLLGALGVAAGYEIADPLAGLVITLALLVILANAARDIFYRLMDAVDPELVENVRGVLADVQGVVAIGDVRIRWIGHELRAEVDVTVASSLSMVEAHDIAEAAHHALLHEVPRLMSAIVHANPTEEAGRDHHQVIAHHFSDER